MDRAQELVNAGVDPAYGVIRDFLHLILRASASLEQSNPFVVALDDEHTWYQYHQCFSDPLRQFMKPQEVSMLHRRAARWFESHNYYYDAMRHFLQG